MQIVNYQKADSIWLKRGSTQGWFSFGNDEVSPDQLYEDILFVDNNIMDTVNFLSTAPANLSEHSI